MRLPYYVYPDLPWWKKLACRAWNATILVLWRTPKSTVPRRYRRVRWMVKPSRDAFAYAIWPLHWPLALWGWYQYRDGRWCIERALLRAGVLIAPECGYYHQARWMHPKWWAANRRGVVDTSRFDDPSPFWTRFWTWG